MDKYFNLNQINIPITSKTIKLKAVELPNRPIFLESSVVSTVFQSREKLISKLKFSQFLNI